MEMEGGSSVAAVLLCPGVEKGTEALDMEYTCLLHQCWMARNLVRGGLRFISVSIWLMMSGSWATYDGACNGWAALGGIFGSGWGFGEVVFS